MSQSNSSANAKSKANRKANDAIDSCIFSARELRWKVGEHLILDNLNFDITENKFIGIIGPNGAGKSSLLRCLFGKNQITAGSLHFNQCDIGSFSRKSLAKEIAVVLQEPPTHFDMTVFEIVSMGLIPKQSLFAFSSKDEREAISRAIQAVELSHKTQMPFNTLSGGEKQRVMLARAIVQHTKILILDEPTNHLDIQHQISILHLVKAMGITVLLSLHDLNMAAAFCDELILMDKGKIVAQGDCVDVLSSENLSQVFNVNAKLDLHPFHSGMRISYDFSTNELEDSDD